MIDVLIIGAGITGCFLAHDLSKTNLNVTLIDKESDIANGATMANSAIIHSGHDPLDNTLKAKLNVRGNEMYEGICKELHVDFKRTSAFVVATSKEEEKILDTLYDQAKRRNIPVEFLTGDEARQKEENLSDNVTKAIELESTGIVYPWEVAIALAEEAVLNGVDVRLNEEVKAIEKNEDYFTVNTQKGSYNAKIVINAAGAYSDKIYEMVSENNRFKITPRRGEYFVLAKMDKPIVQRVIYPVPSSAGKGVLVVPTTHGNVLLGPNSEFVDEAYMNCNTKEQLEYVKEQVAKTVKNIPMNQIIREFAGIRPTSTAHDFIIEEADDVKNFINVAGIESPGLASSPAISEYVLENILKDKVDLSQKSEYIKRKPNIDLKKLSTEEKNKLVKENPAFGRIVCRCEKVTEGEILDAIHRPLGAKTVKAVKKRTRPGMGKCQGGFCEPLVVDILARELKVDKTKIMMDSENSPILVEETKEQA